MSEIKPALTAEEWAKVQAAEPFQLRDIWAQPELWEHMGERDTLEHVATVQVFPPHIIPVREPNGITSGFAEPVIEPALVTAYDDEGELNVSGDLAFGFIALCNYVLPDDDLRKITKADVEACLQVARDWEYRADESLEWGHRETQYEWERRAAKLAALLPPETSGE